MNLRLELSEDAVDTLRETVLRRRDELGRLDPPTLRLRQSIADTLRELDEVLDEIERVSA